jgi:hypothetical protein
MADGVVVRVVAVRHRAQRTTAVGELATASVPLRLEFQVSAGSTPAVGTAVSIQLDPSSASVFAL